jgi:peptide/nickel transport system substrate-binding protein
MGGRMQGLRAVASWGRVWWLVLVTLVGCSAAGPVAPVSGERSAPARSSSAAPKVLTIAQTANIKMYGPWEFSSTASGVAALAEIHTTGLVTYDASGNREGRLAARLPSFDDGTIAILPDGRMRTVWSLRPNVRWHDGVPFTADDAVFSWRIAVQPEILSSISPHIWGADSVEAPDAQTLVITYKTPYFRALDMDHRNFWMFPQHILGDAFAADKESFLGQPYFSSEYVNLGPFRLVDFGLGETQVFEAFDGYFLGQPKIQKVVIQTITDPNAMLAALKAGAVQLISEKTATPDQAVQLRDEWAQSGEGGLVFRQDNWAYISPQFDPHFARPAELSRDPRLRAGLLHAIDRDAIRDFVHPGFPDTSGDTFVKKNDSRSAQVGEPFARYTYDRTRAAQLFAEGGWVRNGDGPLVSADGRQVQIETRGGNQTWTKEVALIADFWRQVGIDAQELVPTPALSRDNEFSATFPGIVIRARGSADGMLVSFDGRLQATQQNRWQGANYAHYANPRLDSLINGLEATVDPKENGLVLRDVGQLFEADLPALPIYFRTAYAAMRKNVKALTDDYQGQVGDGDMARNAHRWEMD